MSGPPYSSVLSHSRVINDDALEGNRGPVRRTSKTELIGIHGLYGCLTLYESFRRSVSIFPNKACLGERLVDSAGRAGPYVFQTYSQCDSLIHSFANGLRQQNLLGTNDQNLQLLGIYMKNCTYWTVAEYACYSMSAATVPIYDTLGKDTVSYVINHTNMKACICSPREVSRLCEAANSCPTFKYIILHGTATDVESSLCKKANVNLITVDELIRIGKAFSHKPIVPSAESLATFCYTSGTTGDPKGALISHRNIISVAAAALNSCFDIRHDDYYLSFLPLPHIFERMVVSALISCGSAIGFYQGDPLKLIDDCIALRPSIFCAVPRVLNKIHDKIVSGMNSEDSGVKGQLFKLALKSKLSNLKSSKLDHWLWDKLIFKKITNALGLEKVRRLVSGGAPLSVETMNFFRILFGREATIHEDLSTAGHVGGPLPVAEICLADVVDMDYRGEILVRGPNVFKGYYKNEKATKEALTRDGWLRTGDIGMWRPDGQLAIIDRKKNLLKLSQGEYVAIEKVENILGRSACVNQIFVYGSSTEDCLIAVVVPDLEFSTKWIAENTNNGKFPDFVLSELLKLGQEYTLKGFELVFRVHIDFEIGEWGPTNGLTTPTLKLKRKALEEKYSVHLKEMYKDIKMNGKFWATSRL
eukprot:GSChrysophyteH1.ASY1.ANO1.606.1 assembled CDS